MSNMNVPKKIIDNIVSVLIHLDTREANISAYEFGNRGIAIKNILNKVEDDFGFDFMIHLFMITSKQLEHTLGPLDISIVEKLTSVGYGIKKVTKVCEYFK